MDLANTFDTSNALSGMFLWMIFGFLSAMLNCDIQRFMKNSMLWIHFFGITAFFFLFAILDSNNKTSIGVVWLKTIILYFIFLMMTKSKWYFIVPVIILLLIDQSIKRDLAMKKALERDTTTLENFQKKFTLALNIIVLVLVFIGTLHYMYLQYKEYGSNFSFIKFLFAVGTCKNV